MGVRQQNSIMLICTNTIQKNVLNIETEKLNTNFLYISLHSGSQRPSIKSSSMLLLPPLLPKNLIWKQSVEFHCNTGLVFFSVVQKDSATWNTHLFCLGDHKGVFQHHSEMTYGNARADNQRQEASSSFLTALMNNLTWALHLQEHNRRQRAHKSHHNASSR